MQNPKLLYHEMKSEQPIEIKTVQINVEKAAKDVFAQLRESDSISPLILSIPTETVERYIQAALEIGIALEQARAMEQQKEIDRLKANN